MSVPVGERSESKLVAHEKTEDMIVHTIKILANEKVFDPNLHALADRVIDLAVSIGQDMWEANGIRVGDDPRRWEVRRHLQERACRHFDVLLYLMGLCRKAYRLRSRKYYAWVNKVREARDLTRKWRDADVRRYGRLESGWRR